MKMKLRFSFTLKILLPYLILLVTFFLVFLGVLGKGLPVPVGLSLAGMLGSLLMGIVHLYWLKRPLNRVSRLVEQLTRGIIPRFLSSKTADEIGQLERGLEKHVSNLRDMAAFSRSMAQGDFTAQYNELSSKDELGEALNTLKVSLMDSRRETELRQHEEEIRTWSAQGLAKFSSLFREAEENLNELSSQVMRELVNYTEADAGALFIARGESEKEEPYLENAGNYAFDRKKEIQRTFKFGEGLVGRAAQEKELIFVSDLPPDYIKIRSGLGEDKPSSIILVPVVLDQEVLGVMELASLGEFPSHQVDFVKQLADALATTLAKVKAHLKNRELYEQTKKQAEALASQEKVFRENMVQLKKEIEELRKGSS